MNTITRLSSQFFGFCREYLIVQLIDPFYDIAFRTFNVSSPDRKRIIASHISADCKFFDVVLFCAYTAGLSAVIAGTAKADLLFGDAVAPDHEAGRRAGERPRAGDHISRGAYGGEDKPACHVR